MPALACEDSISASVLEILGASSWRKPSSLLLSATLKSWSCRHGVTSLLPVAIMRALQKETCPELRVLDLVNCGLTPVDGQALADAIKCRCNLGYALHEVISRTMGRLGRFAKLERLELRADDSLGEVGLNAIFGALEAGCCFREKA